MDSYISCHPIVDGKNRVLGHEYQCETRAHVVNALDYGAGFMHGAQVLVGLLTNHNIPPITKSHTVFISVPMGTLHDTPLLHLIPDCAVLEFYLCDPSEDLPHQVDAFEQLKLRGIGIAFDAGQITHFSETICKSADYIKVDASSPDAAALFANAHKLKAKIIARNVNSAEIYALALHHNAHYFQGAFLQDTSRLKCDFASPNLDTSLKLLEMLDRDAGIREIEVAVMRAPNLMVRLLTYANSPLLGSRKAIHSVGEAVTFLGHRNLYTLVVLMLYVTDGGLSQALIQRVLFRAKLMELVGMHGCNNHVPESSLLFLIGALSTFKDIYPAQIAKIVERISLPERAASALLWRRGQYGNHLSLVESCSKYDIPRVEESLAQLKIDANSINEYQFEAIAWSGIAASNF